MTDYFVHALSGNDSNSGLSAGLAKKTIGAAYLLAASGDSIYLTGYFKESLLYSTVAHNSKAINWRGYPHAVLDYHSVPVPRADVGFTASQTYADLSFLNATWSVINARGYYQHVFNRCRFINCASAFQIIAVSQYAHIFIDCVFAGANNIIQNRPSNQRSLPLHIEASISADNSLVLSHTQGYNDMRTNILRCVIANGDNQTVYHVPYLYAHPNAFHLEGLTNFNAYQTGFIAVTNTGNYAGLAAWRGSINSLYAPQFEQNSQEIDARAELDDPNHGLYRVSINSPLRIAGPARAPIGPAKAGIAISENCNSSLFTNGIFSNTQISHDGWIELIPGQSSGYWRSDVLDLGAGFYRVNALEIGHRNESGAYGAGRISYGSAGSMTLRVRSAASKFSKADASPAWVEVPAFGDLAGTAGLDLNGRFWQAEVTINAG